MPSISSAGVGSGLDIESIIGQLMALERRPLVNLLSKQAETEAQISAYGALKSTISSFQSAMQDLSATSKFQVFAAASSDSKIFSATADSTAAVGSYSLNVTNLAERHKLASSAFAGTTTVVGTGTLTLTVGSTAFNVTVDSSNNTLSGIRDAINNATANTGVSATLITEDAGTRLVLTSNDTGTSKALKVTVTGDGDGNDTDNAGLSQLVYDTAGGTTNLTELQAAEDATLTIDGGTINVTSASNTVANAIQGVTLTLAASGTATLTVSRDTVAVTKSVQAFVDAYNQLKGTVDNMRGQALRGDATMLLSLESQIRGVLNTPASGLTGSFSYLFEIGIASDRSGKLTLDSSVLSKALTKDFSGVSELFAHSTQGFAKRLDDLADVFLGTNGIVDARTTSLKSEVNHIETRKDSLEHRLKLVEARLRSQFTALDALVSRLNSTSSFLSQQLQYLPTNKRSS